MNSTKKAKQALVSSWPKIKSECLSVLGSELHYQAMIYHCLRVKGKVPSGQLGMNVKMWIDKPRSKLFRALDKRKHELFQGGFEPIPDVVIFRPQIKADWRRRNKANTLRQMLLAIEVKASERAGSRLRAGEIRMDIDKLAAHRDEVLALGASMYPVMMVIDSAPVEKERMTSLAIEKVTDHAAELKVGLLYCSPASAIEVMP